MVEAPIYEVSFDCREYTDFPWMYVQGKGIRKPFMYEIAVQMSDVNWNLRALVVKIRRVSTLIKIGTSGD